MMRLASRWIRACFRISLRLVPLLAAVAVVVVLMRTRSAPARKPEEEISRSLRVIAAPRVALSPYVLGYGVAEPGRVWHATAEVRGTVLTIHPRLRSGALVDAGTVLLTMDPTDYELTVARLKASIAETRARFEELSARERSEAASLEIEKRSLTLAQKSLDRLRELRDQNVAPADEVDREARHVLQQEQAIQQLENGLSQIPARRDALNAALAMHEASLRLAERDVARTVIRAPFECRLGDVSLQAGQVLLAGQQLFEAHGTDTVEVEGRFRPEQLQQLLPAEKRQQFEPGITVDTLGELFDVTVTIRLRSGSWKASWRARFDRIREVVDPRTRGIVVVAVVDAPYEQVVPGVRPALVRGMYCEMELRAPARPGTVVLPRTVVRQGTVYLVDNAGRLASRTVRTAFTQGDLVVVEAGLDGGETVIVSDPTPAIEGMKVAPVVDEDLRRHLIAQAENREGAAR